MFKIIILTSTLLLPVAETPPPNPPYDYYDARARQRLQFEESAQERARREWQERWPAMKHCRLPACSTR